MDEQSVATNRANFPHGLRQPEGGFRFGADALALLEFAGSAKLPPPGKIVDIGCGCGVLGLGLLLQYAGHAGAEAVGLDNNQQMLSLAAENASSLGLPFRPLAADALQTEHLKAIKSSYAKNGFDLAVCNPPWRLIQTGRTPPDLGRKTAMYGDNGTVAKFIATADYLLKNGGSLLLVCGAERLADCLGALPKRLRPVRLRLVHPRPAAEAVFCLLEARKNARAWLVIEPPLLMSPS